MPNTVPCHSCTSHPGQDDSGNVCPRCHGESLRDVAEAAAHLAFLAARETEQRAIAAVRTATNKYAAGRDVEVATAARRRARDVWENELARLAAEEVAA